MGGHPVPRLLIMESVGCPDVENRIQEGEKREPDGNKMVRIRRVQRTFNGGEGPISPVRALLRVFGFWGEDVLSWTCTPESQPPSKQPKKGLRRGGVNIEGCRSVGGGDGGTGKAKKRLVKGPSGRGGTTNEG